MAKVDLIGMDHKPTGSMELSGVLTDSPFNPFMIKEAVVYQQAKLRQGTHAVKSRGLINGSNKKLFRQKGTGSARAGSRKAPQRRGGGVAHGPVPRSHAIGMNKKVRKAALRCALAEKLRRGQLVVLESFELDSHKTKPFAQWLEAAQAPSALLVTEVIQPNLALASRNLPSVDVIHYSQLNVYNLLLREKTLITKAALEALQERLTG